MLGNASEIFVSWGAFCQSIGYPLELTSRLCTDKGRGILFGGVHDVEESEEGIDSEFFDALFAWSIERNRYFQLSLKRARIAPKKHADQRVPARKDRSKADEADLLRNLATLETKDSTGNAATTNALVDIDMPDIPVKHVKPVMDVMPHPRFNAHLAVHDDVLYILGGIYEQEDAEYTFDEM